MDVLYPLLMVLFRLTGIRRLAAMNTFDYIVIFLLSNVVQNAVSGNDTWLLGGMVGAVTLVAGQPAHRKQSDRQTLLRGRATTVAAHRFKIAPPRPAAKRARTRGAATKRQ
jgi:uncharacterized membrane protein YcaP (DUF421 family)